MKKIALISLLACLMTGCHINYKGEMKFSYEHPERYQMGDAVISQTVNELDINWLEGDIDIVYVDHPEVRIYEKTDSILDDSLSMHWYLDDEGCLDIQFCKNGFFKTQKLNNLGKHLTIEVPRGTVLNEIDMSLVSASVNIDSVASRELTVDGVAFGITANYPTLPNEINIDGVDCHLNLQAPLTAGMTIEMSGVKKYLNITSERPTRKEGKKTILGDGACEIDIEGVNCTLNVNEL
ncbi:MAG: hypothetical protein J6X79_00710 [Bacteroidales bacterium]|nr:hypothetical protein [Bacteroidales bacterium]